MHDKCHYRGHVTSILHCRRTDAILGRDPVAWVRLQMAYLLGETPGGKIPESGLGSGILLCQVACTAGGFSPHVFNVVKVLQEVRYGSGQ